MNKIFKVARQEFKMTAGNKAFVIITLLGPFLLLAFSIIPPMLARSQNNIKENTLVALVGAGQPMADELNQSLKKSNLSLAAYTDETKAKSEVREGTIQGYITLPVNYQDAGSIVYYSKSGTDMVVFETVKGILGNYIIAKRMINAGLDAQLVQRLSVQPWIDIKKIAAKGKEGTEEGFFSILMTGISFIMLIYMTVILYGQLIGRSVIVEKTSKTVEIMLSSITPRQMMFGKIIGIGLAGLIQYGFWIILTLVMIKFAAPVLKIVPPAAINPGNLLFLLLFFILAYALYSCLYTALGAAAEDEQHLSQLQMPFLMFLILPMMLISPIIMNPSSLLSKVLSYFPMTSPIVMFIRILVETPQAWEIILSIALAVLTIFLIILGAARIFRIGILMTGKRFTLGEVVKWLRIK